MAEQQETTWIYPMTAVTENKERLRAGTEQSSRVARELIGFDGALDGGLRLWPGLLEVCEFKYGYDGSSAGLGGVIHKGDVFGFECRLNFNLKAYGFIYRVTNSGETQARYRVVYRVGEDSTWRYEAESPNTGFTNGLIGTEAYNGEAMDVVVWGKFIYVLREGLEPFMIYFERVATDDLVRVEDDTGPGTPPVWNQTIYNRACLRSRDDMPGVPHPDLTEILPDYVNGPSYSPGTDSGVSRVCYFDFSDALRVSFDGGINFEMNPHLYQRSGPTLGVDARALRGPYDLRNAANTQLWSIPVFGTSSTPQFSYNADQDTWGSGVDVEGGGDGGLTANVVYSPDMRDADTLEPAYVFSDIELVFAFQLTSSVTGRKSPVSEFKAVKQLGGSGVAYTVDYRGAVGGGLASGQTYAVTFPAVFVNYDSDKFDGMVLWWGTRLASVNDTEVSVGQTTLYKEAVFQLADYWITPQPTGMGDYKTSGWFIQNTLDTITQQDVLAYLPQWLPDMPTGGSGVFFENILFLGKLGNSDVENGSLGLIRWSDITETSVELFRPNDRYVLSSPTEEVERFLILSPHVFAFTQQGLYLLRKEGVILRVFPVQGSVGIVNKQAACKVGNVAYYVSEQGVKTIAADGALSDVAVFNALVIDEWKDDLGDLQMAYDAAMSCIFLTNVAAGHAAMFYFNAATLREIIDLPVISCFEAWVPADPESGATATNPIKQRACFLAEWTKLGGGADDNYWRVLFTDYLRTKTTPQMMPTNASPLRFTLGVQVAAGATSMTLPFVTTDNIAGCYIYALDGTDGVMGQKVFVDHVVSVGASTSTLSIESAPVTFPVGTRMGISPIYARWVGAPLWIYDQFGNPVVGDMTQIRMLQKVWPSFVDVSGAASTDDTNRDARFRALGYRGSDGTPVDYGVPTDPNEVSKFLSVKNGVPEIAGTLASSGGVSGSIVLPGLEVFCPELEFTLLGVACDGKIQPYRRRRMAETRLPGT